MSLIYKGQNLFVDNTSVKSIAKNNITPFYVYSYKKIRNNFETFSNYFIRIDIKWSNVIFGNTFNRSVVYK